jgi:hypothetical protein
MLARAERRRLSLGADVELHQMGLRNQGAIYLCPFSNQFQMTKR